MRIVVVGNFGLTGKQTMAVRALPLAEALAGRGHRVSMALPIRRDGDLGGPRERGGVEIRYAGRGLRLPGLSHLWQVLVLAVLCLRWRPQAVFCFKPIAHAGAVLGLFWLLRRLGLYQGVLALDTDDWEGEGGWNDRQPLPGWVKVLIGWQERWSLRHADVVTVASRELLEMARRAGARQVVCFPNALGSSSPGLLAPADPGLRARLGMAGRPVILLYTRFVEFRVNRLLDVFQGVLRGATEALLLVVGQGLDGEERDLARLAADRGIADRVVLAGWVEPSMLTSYFHLADVALYPLDDTLLNRTKCPMKLLDLLAAGVPVVADRVGQAAEYVDHGRSGLLVSPGDPGAMAAAVLALLADPGRAAGMAKAARAEARSRWRWEPWAAEVERLLAREVLDEDRGLRTED